MRMLSPFTSMLGAGIGVGAVAGLVAAGKAANEFGGAMNRSLAIMADVGPEMRREMEKTAAAIARDTQFSAKEAAEAYFFLASAGMNAKQSLAAMPAVSKFAAAGNFSLSLATDLATDSQSALGMKSKDASKNLKNLTAITDQLVKANTVANASVQQFSEALTNKAGVAMKMYGITSAEGLAVLSAFADQGIKGADAGTKFGIVLRDLTTKAITNKKAFEDIGLRVFEGGEIRNLADIILDLENKFKGLSDEQRKATLLSAGFTDKSVSGLQALIGYSQQIRDWQAALEQAGGTVDQVSDKVLTKFDKAWNKASASIGLATREFFPPLLDALADIIDRTAGASKGIKDVGDAAANLKPPPRTGGELWGETAADYAVEFEKAARTVHLAWAQLMSPDPNTQRLKDLRQSLARVGMDPDVTRQADIAQAEKAAALKRRRDGTLTNKELLRDWQDQMKAAYNIDPISVWDSVSQGIDKATRVAGTYASVMKDIAATQAEATAEQAKQLEEEQASQAARAKALFASTRTPLENFKSGVADLISMLDSGMLSGEMGADIAARKFTQLKGEFEGSVEKPTPTVDPGFAPALLAGTREAYSALIRAARPDNMREPAEATAKATAEAAALLAQIKPILDAIKNNASKPGTTETAP
jgi:TP901 family phage tail tape measure protein